MAVPIEDVPTTDGLPVVVIESGPRGLAAAAHLIERHLEPLILEAGPSAGSAVREWSHVRLLSTWANGPAPAATKLLALTDWASPDGATYPTGVARAEPREVHAVKADADTLTNPQGGTCCAGPATDDVGANEPVTASGCC